MNFTQAHKQIQGICSSGNTQENNSIFCLLHDKNYLGTHDNDHVCLGCSLDDSIRKIDRFLSQSENKDDPSPENIEYLFTIYILLLYLTVEKFHIVFKFIGITWDYVNEKWPVLVEIRKWANFIKHPKGFLFTHHPQYVFETSNYNRNDAETLFIGRDFVSKFYFKEDEAKFKQTIQEIGNKDNIVVILPCPDRLAKEFAIVCSDFCEKIRANPHFKEVLKNHVVIIDGC